MVIQEKLYTADDLWEMIRLPEYADKQLELIEGLIYEMAPSSFIPSMIGIELGSFIRNFVREHDLGYVTGADGAYQLTPKTVLAPDVGFVAKHRVTTMPERFFPLAPDLAVEVVSPTDSVKAVQRKAARYIAHGTRMVVIVYPDDKSIDVCRPAEDADMTVQEIGIDGVLDGGDVLPGFKLPVRDIFKVIPEEKKP